MHNISWTLSERSNESLEKNLRKTVFGKKKKYLALCFMQSLLRVHSANQIPTNKLCKKQCVKIVLYSDYSISLTASGEIILHRQINCYI